MTGENTDNELTAEQINELKEKASKYEEIAPEFEKLKGKEMNFEKLREAKEKTEEAKHEKETEIERIKRETGEWRAAEEAKLRQAREEHLKEAKEAYLKNLCGDDTKSRDLVLFEMENLKGDVSTEAQLREKMEKAFTIVSGSKPSASAFTRGIGATSPVDSSQSSKDFGDTAEGQSALKKVFKGRVDVTKLTKKSGSYFDN